MDFVFLISLIVCLNIANVISANCTMRGMYAPVFTPFDDKGLIDTSVLDDYAKYISERGVKGIYVADTTGEGPNLSETEKKLLYKCWMPIAKKYKLRVVAQIGGGSEGEMINLAKYCKRLKMDAITVLPTVFFKPKSIEEVTQLLEAISKAAPSTPIQYIDYPRFTKLELDIPALFSLATQRIPEFIGMTVDVATAVQISAVNQLRPDQTLCIRDHILISAAVLLGYRCFTTTAINVYPLAIAHVIKHAADGNIKMARKSQFALNNVIARIIKEGNMLSSHKVAMELYAGIKVGDPRLPIQPISAQGRENIEAITDTLASSKSLSTYQLSPKDLEKI